MKHSSIKTIASIALLFASAFSSADTIFDFQDLTDRTTEKVSGILPDGNTFGLANPYEIAFETFKWEKDDLVLDVSASYHGKAKYKQSYRNTYQKGDTARGWAYLDGGNAGLGVCSLGYLSAGNQTFANKRGKRVRYDSLAYLAS